MSYYSKEQRRKIEEILNNYIPPTTYKDKKPSEEEFEIKDLDIELIEKERKKFLEQREKYKKVGMFSLALGAFPGMQIFFVIGRENLLFIASIPWIIFVIFCFVLGSIKYPKENLYKKIKNYNNAMWEHNWWQLRKQKDFWFSLNGRKFEIEISRIFKKMGYKTKICKQGGDEGVDLEIEKDGVYEIIQCKAHKSKISPSVARDLLGTMYNKNIKHAYLITLNGGTTGTMDFCKNNNITLWDINDIIKHNK